MPDRSAGATRALLPLGATAAVASALPALAGGAHFVPLLSFVLITLGGGLSFVLARRQGAEHHAAMMSIADAAGAPPDVEGVIEALKGTREEVELLRERAALADEIDAAAIVISADGAVQRMTEGFRSFVREAGSGLGLPQDPTRAAGALVGAVSQQDAGGEGRHRIEFSGQGFDVSVTRRLGGGSTVTFAKAAANETAESDGVLTALLDVEGRIRKIDNRFADALGMRAEALSGKPFADLVKHEADEVAEAIAAKRTGPFVLALRRADRSTLGIAGDFSRESSGGFRVTALDATARIKPLKDAARYYECLLSGQAAIEFEPDGTIRWANRAFSELMGFTRDEMVGSHHRIFVDAADPDTPDDRSFWQTLRDGEAVADTFRRRNKHGEEVYLLGRYSPLFDEDGGVSRVFLLVSDVTEQERRALREQDARRRTSRTRSASSGCLETRSRSSLTATSARLSSRPIRRGRRNSAKRSTKRSSALAARSARSRTSWAVS